jgi:hypothetical protein
MPPQRNAICADLPEPRVRVLPYKSRTSLEVVQMGTALKMGFPSIRSDLARRNRRSRDVLEDLNFSQPAKARLRCVSHRDHGYIHLDIAKKHP